VAAAFDKADPQERRLTLFWWVSMVFEHTAYR